MVRGGAPTARVPIYIESSLMVHARQLGMALSGIALNAIGTRIIINCINLFADAPCTLVVMMILMSDSLLCCLLKQITSRNPRISPP